jgi:acetyl esterase/lipase
MKFNFFAILVAMIFSLSLGCALRKVRPEYDYFVEKNKVYKTIDGIELTGELYLPNTKGLRPAVIVVHGGSWSKRLGDMRGVASYLAKQGFVVFNVTYRLAPKHLYPAAIEDVTDAVKWVQANADQYKIDSERIAGWGYSAGSHIILMVGLNSKNNLKAIVAGGSPTDLTAWPNSPIVKTFIGGSYKEKPKVWEEASPVFQVKKDSPPVYLFHGKNDTLVEVDQMYRLEKALKSQNVLVSTYEVGYWSHAGVYVFSHAPIKMGTEFLFQQLKL